MDKFEDIHRDALDGAIREMNEKNGHQARLGSKRYGAISNRYTSIGFGFAFACMLADAILIGWGTTSLGERWDFLTQLLWFGVCVTTFAAGILSASSDPAYRGRLKTGIFQIGVGIMMVGLSIAAIWTKKLPPYGLGRNMLWGFFLLALGTLLTRHSNTKCFDHKR